jgi:thioredoxin reductase
LADHALDPKSNAGKPPIPGEHVPLLVIGAGPAGLSAAIAAANRGIPTVLVDENPVPFAVMGEDVPRHFGQGMSAAARHPGAMLEAFIASEPLFEQAFEAGVDIRPGTACWGLYANGPALRVLPGLIAGLASETGNTLLQADQVIIATGRRDMGLGFPGWQLPGVMGASAAALLATRYAGAMTPRRAIILGSGMDALLTALAMARRGIEIAAVIEQAAHPVGSPDLVAELAALGIPVRCRQVVREALGRDAVEAVMVGHLDAAGRTVGVEERIACDGVILAVGAVPMIDLLDAAGAAIAFDVARGGHVPCLDPVGRTSLPGVFAIGDCAGVWAEKSAGRAVAEAEAKRAVAALAGEPDMPPQPLPPVPETDLTAYRQAWIRASVIEARAEFPLCQCEEVTAREILELRPPRYLEWEGQPRADHSLANLLEQGPPNPDQIKRLTRAGMGPCQGRRCREQIAALLALQGAIPLASVPLASYRAPVRPLPLGLAGTLPEHPAQTEHWDSWFGMHAQWRPFWEVPANFTLAGNDTSGEVASE